MTRAHNFSAGPAVLPLSVLHELQEALPEFGGTGLGLMEMSHRSKTFDGVLQSAKERLGRVLGIPADYRILFLQGGASQQFYQVPLNLLGAGEGADFVITGVWAKKALAEAIRLGPSQAAWTGATEAFRRVPNDPELDIRNGSLYLHYTTNNTIYGTQIHHTPEAPLPLVADMSSDICSRPIEVGRHALIYAGAQKNLGPSGVTAVIMSPWAEARVRAVSAAKGGSIPAVLDYGLYLDNDSLYNTPNTFGIFALERVLAWLEAQGGLPGITAINEEKAALLYSELDRSAFWRPYAAPESRSRMNITWNIHDPTLEADFLAQADKAGMKGLKGHRSTGGIRASLYNACPLESVEALVAFMRGFESARG